MNEIVSTLSRNAAGETFLGIIKDKVVLAILSGLALLAFFDPPQVGKSISSTLDSALFILPFFALAMAFAGYAKASGLDGTIAKAFSGNIAGSIVAAALMGALSPFCSCGVIPLIAALLAAGVPLPAVMAFWIASPIMDPEIFILTAAGIGFDFAVAKTFAAIGLGLFAGFATLGVERAGFLKDPLVTSPACSSCCGSSGSSDDKGQVVWAFWREPERVEAFLAEFRQTGWFLGKWLTLAFFLESLMVAYIPSDWIASAVGSGNAFAIPIAAIIGMPSYMNGYAAIPLVGGLIKLGMTPAAGLAFMTAGAVSSVPAAIAVYALVRKPVFMLYILLGITGSVIAAYLYLLSLTVT